jgi:hypothetical protein
MLNEARWKKIQPYYLFVKRWCDPKSHRFLVMLFVVSMAVFLAPLAWDVARALFFAIPQSIRHAMGQGVILATIAAGLVRISLVRETDSWPSEDAEDASPSSPAERWLLGILALAVLSLAAPIMQHPDGLGFSDWDFVLDKFEALRRTILIWKQFPWWNPWCRGGFPLAAEPQIGAVSMATPLVLALGTTIGLRLSAILCLLIAVLGAYRLACLWLRDSWASTASAMVYGLNGAVVISTSLGYVLPMSYCSVPWLAYFACRIGRRFSDALWLGFWMAFVVMNGIQYMSVYAVPLLALIWVRAVRVQPRVHLLRLLCHSLASLGVFLLICGWRLVSVLLVLMDDKRERVTSWNETPLSMLHYLLHRPAPNWTDQFNAAQGVTFAELSCYVGPVVLGLAFVSLWFGWRWWHMLAILSFWLALGSVSWYHPSSWLASWPLFGSAHVVTRWRYMALLGLGLAAGSVLARWRASPRPAVRAVAVLLVMVIAGDFLILGHQQLPRAFSVEPRPELFPGPPVPEIVNVRSGLGYPCTLRGYGVIQGYEPMLSYYRNAPTLRRSRDDPDYRGEAWTDRGPVQPVFWSPNRVVFQVDPFEEVHLNQNPGSWWLANGRRAFPNARCAELMIPFVAQADGRGSLDLTIRPRGLETGLLLHFAGAGLLALSSLVLARQASRGLVS